MHDKTAIFDGVAGLTGGRNMAAEYFGFNHEFNFRDRDVLLLGSAVRDMQKHFNEFWESDFAVPVEKIFEDQASRYFQRGRSPPIRGTARLCRRSGELRTGNPAGDRGDSAELRGAHAGDGLGRRSIRQRCAG
jgi:phosphatidylserine/phosphatidylglycerophosphate/cardiolipin synthase-like enzyme